MKRNAARKQFGYSMLGWCAMACCSAFADEPAAKASHVRVVEENGAYRLQVNGAPFYIKGAGMSGDEQDALAEGGANSFRTWDTGLDRERVTAMLERAQHNRLMVAMGIAVGKERHGFNYDDENAVREQQERILREVRLYKDHPAVLMWVVGNELNLEHRNPKVWDAIGAIAEAIHRVDPDHPVMTTLAGIDAPLIHEIRTRAPALDLIGIQLYGDIEALPQKLRESQWTGPYVVTEWGPTGHWESPLTTWKAAVEEDASRKALRLAQRYQRYIAADTRQGLGSYVFLWGQKQERTPTWYGLFLESGESTPSVDVMQYLWTGRWPANRAPSITPITVNGQDATRSVTLAPGSWNDALAESRDPDGDAVSYRWLLREESRAVSIGGDPETLPDAVDTGMQVEQGRLRFRAPERPGAYRLFVEAHDGKGHAAYANFPLQVAAH